MKFGTPHHITREKYRHPCGDAWFRWFAWRPVRTDQPEDRWVWFEWVEKRYHEGMTYWPPQYRLPKLGDAGRAALKDSAGD